MPSERAADDGYVTRRIQELKYLALRRGQECEREAGRSASACWCMGLGLNKIALPCPEVGCELPDPSKEIPL
jgi:hypothetical protein